MHLLSNHLPAHVFVPIITRETPGLLPKPDPDGILHIAKEWGLENAGENLIMVCLFLFFSSFLYPPRFGWQLMIPGRG